SSSSRGLTGRGIERRRPAEVCASHAVSFQIDKFLEFPQTLRPELNAGRITSSTAIRLLLQPSVLTYRKADRAARLSETLSDGGISLKHLKSIVYSATLVVLLSGLVFAQEGLQVIREVKHDTSAPLRSLPAAMVAPALLPPHSMRPVLKPGVPLGAANRPDTALQTTHLPFVSANLGLSFEGLGQGQYGFSVTGAPADPNGAVGATQYVQWVNTSFAVFDKSTGALLMGPVAGNALWAGFGGGCQNNNDGDPIASYDQLANRWVMTQFSVSTTPFLQCVAVSTTNDATGSYNRYAFQLPNFNDYPKM